ncbi:hypothetical protein MN608_00878 [Microdochium nivale]|nr:hypothetical protein MN608_00878 [Microdochium nivale]
MASRSVQIPRFLLPQNGPAWRAAATRSGALPRTFTPEQAQLLVRYATTTAKPKTAAKTVTKAVPKSAAKITTKAAPKAAAAKTTTAAKTATKTTTATPKTPASRPVIPPTTATPKAASPPPSPNAPSPANPIKTAPASTSRATAAEPATVTPVTSEAGVADSLPASLDADRAGPIILEQPDAFRPPSHGKRLPRATPKHYGGGPTAEEIQAQRAKQYPGMPPPENTWSHWFINSRGIHLFITLGTLSSLAMYTFAVNFNEKSPVAHLIPPISDLPRHPFSYIGACIEVLKMHEEHESAITAEKRRQKVDDVAKRNEFRKAHGLEPASGVAPWASPRKPEPAEDKSTAAAAAGAPQQEQTEAAADNHPITLAETGQYTEDGKRKKFLGIF